MAMSALSSGSLFPPMAAGLRVGLYGGSFNPLHAGHVHVAQTALVRLRLDAIWWLVSPGNPLKAAAGAADYQQRLTGVLTALAHRPRHFVCTAEAALGTRYSADFLARLLGRAPALRPVWITGGDNLASFHRWKHWRAIVRAVPVAIIARPQQALRARFSPMASYFAAGRLPEQAAPVLADQTPPAWLYLSAPLHWHSSTQIRKRGSD